MAVALRSSGTAQHGVTNLNVPVGAGTTSGDAMLCIACNADNNALTFPTPLPVFRAAGTKSAGTTGAVTVAAPAGVATGDLEILVAATISGQTVSITTSGGGSWTSLGSSTCTSGEDMFAWWRVRAGGDSDPQVTPSGDHSVSVRLAYKTGTFDSTTPIANWTTSNENTSDTSFSWAPGFSTAPDYSLVLVISTSGVDSNTAQVPVCTDASLSSLASRANYETSNGGGGGFGITEGALAAHGAVGTFACTYVGASPKAYASFSISPDPTATSWTSLAALNNGTSQRLSVFGKVAGSSEGTFVLTYGGSNTIVAQCHTFSGTNTSPFVLTGATNTGSGSGATLTITALGITPTYTNSGIVFVGASGESAGTGGSGGNNYGSWSGTDPTFTEIMDILGQDGTKEASAGSAWGLTTDGAATGNRTVAVSGLDGGAYTWIGMLLEIADASPTSGGGGGTASTTTFQLLGVG